MVKIIFEKIFLNTKKDGNIYDITKDVNNLLLNTDLKDGNITLFTLGSTCSISTIEYEKGVLKDFKNVFEKIVPNIEYEHHKLQNDDNGRSHIKSTMMGPSLVVVFKEQKLLLGTWQQIAFFEWDTRDRRREIIVQIIGK